MRLQLAIPGRLGVGDGTGVGAAVGAGEGDDEAAGDLLLPQDGNSAAIRATVTADRRVPTNIRPPSDSSSPWRSNPAGSKRTGYHGGDDAPPPRVARSGGVAGSGGRGERSLGAMPLEPARG